MLPVFQMIVSPTKFMEGALSVSTTRFLTSILADQCMTPTHSSNIHRSGYGYTLSPFYFSEGRNSISVFAMLFLRILDVRTKGRHDPCVGIRGAPVVEAMMALVLADQKLMHQAQCG